nr:MAG TPA: hypothetical protein [Bacteriophage sp.]
MDPRLSQKDNCRMQRSPRKKKLVLAHLLQKLLHK